MYLHFDQQELDYVAAAVSGDYSVRSWKGRAGYRNGSY